MRAANWLLVALAFGSIPLSAEYADVSGARLFYTDTGGSGVPVILLHAATGSSQVWQNQQAAFTAAGYRVIAYDRRGWGRSLAAASVKPQSASDDLLALADQLGVQRFHLLGTAAGGIVAIDFALSYPQRLRSVVIANSIGGLQDAGVLALGRRLRPSPQFDALPPEFKELGPAYRAADPEGTARWLQNEKTSRQDGPRPAAQPVRNRLTLAALETIGIPVLVLSGGADLYAPPPLMRIFADRLRSAEFVNLPDAGHSAYWEQPEPFNRAVLNFLRKH